LRVKKVFYKKIVTTKFWKKIFGFSSKVVSGKITDSWKIVRTESWCTLDFYLIGKTPDEARLRLIMSAKKTYPTKEDIKIVDTLLDWYKINHPDMVMKAMNYRIDNQFSGLTNYSEYFVNIVGDLRNV